MDFKGINVGFGNVILAHRVVGIIKADSAPMKRMRQDAKRSNRLVDMTEGRKTRSLIILDTNHIVLSAIQADTLTTRLSASSLMDHEESDEKEG